MKPVSPPKGTEHVIPPPSTDITIGLDTVRSPDISISSFHQKAEVERLLAMTTPSPSPPISLSPPSAVERLARIASTQALINAVNAALQSPPLPPLPPSLYIPPPVDHRDEIPEFEQPRKRIREDSMEFRILWVDLTEGSSEKAPKPWIFKYHRDHMYAHETPTPLHAYQTQAIYSSRVRSFQNTATSTLDSHSDAASRVSISASERLTVMTLFTDGNVKLLGGCFRRSPSEVRRGMGRIAEGGGDAMVV
ncbi:hypothetical protein Tco_1226379 [Tanacetum coccineum]